MTSGDQMERFQPRTALQRGSVAGVLAAAVGTLAVSCTPIDGTLDTGAIATQSEAVLGATSYDSSCAASDVPELDIAYAYARVALNSPAFAECVTRAYSANVTYTPPGFGLMTIGPYVACATDPATPDAQTILTSVRTANPTDIACDYSLIGTSRGGDSPVGGVPANDPAATENITIGSSLGYLQGASAPCFASPNGTSCVSEKGFAELADTILHEVMHRHGYDHVDGPTHLCGIDPSRNLQYANSVNYQVGECIRVVLESSYDNCPVHDPCPNGGLKLQDSIFRAPTCSCVPDPRPTGQALLNASWPVCSHPAWSCDGPQTAAGFLCNAPMNGFYDQLYRQTGSGFIPVATTVQSVADPSLVGVTEFGYVPAPSETSLTYRVCTMYQVSHTPKVCGPPIVVPNTTFDQCTCRPTTCAAELACNRAISDGCGDTIQCGVCANGLACNNGACCPPGTEPDGTGDCICAERPCRKGLYWDPSLCRCALPI